MKKFALIAAAILTLSATSAFAGSKTFGDGSREDSYVAGQKMKSTQANEVKNPARFYRGDKSVENSYYNGRHLNSPMDKHAPKVDEYPRFGDGSPANQQS